MQSRRAREEVQKREAEARETERRRAAEEKAKRQREENAYQERVQPLQRLKFRHEGDIFEGNRVVRRLAAELKRLEDQDNDELRKERERNSWWTYVTSPIYGQVKETKEEKQTRETERLHRLASKSIKKSQMEQQEATLQRSRDALDEVSSKIADINRMEQQMKEEAKRRTEEEKRRAEEAKRQVEEQSRKKWVDEQVRLYRERAERAAREAREAQEARQAEQRVREKAAEEKRKAESEERARARARATGDAARRARQAQYDTKNPSASPYNTCQHRKFWPKLEGSHLCQNCHTIQRRFAFECPGCGIVTCADCRQDLRGERNRNKRNSGRGSDFHGGNRTAFDYLNDFD